MRMVIAALSLFTLLCQTSSLIYEGRLSTKKDWAFLTRFCYKTSSGSLQFYFEYSTDYCCQELILYYDLQWSGVYPQEGKTCREKRATTNPKNYQTLMLSNTVWNSGCKISSYNGKSYYTCKSNRQFRTSRARWWFLVIANCGSSKGLDITYKLTLTNGNSFWTRHFSADEQNILQTDIFFGVLMTTIMLISFYIAYILSQRQLFHTTYKLYLFVILLEVISIVVNISYYTDYGHTGKPDRPLKKLARACHFVSEITFVVLLILLGKGWTVTRGRISAFGQVKLSVFCSFYTVAFVSLLIYEAKSFDPGRVLYIFESPAGAGICILRALAWMWFCYGIFFTMKNYRMKRSFYYPFWLFYTIWFLSGPIVVLISLYVIDPHVREQAINSVDRTVTMMATVFFLVLTRPSAANKNFPFHVRTSQIGIMSGNVSDNGFEAHPYTPSNDIELREIQQNHEIASMFTVVIKETIGNNPLTSISSMQANSPPIPANSLDIKSYGNQKIDVNCNPVDIGKPKLNTNFVNSQGQAYKPKFNSNLVNSQNQADDDPFMSYSHFSKKSVNEKNYEEQKTEMLEKKNIDMFCANKPSKVNVKNPIISQLPQLNFQITAQKDNHSKDVSYSETLQSDIPDCLHDEQTAVVIKNHENLDSNLATKNDMSSSLFQANTLKDAGSTINRKTSLLPLKESKRLPSLKQTPSFLAKANESEIEET